MVEAAEPENGFLCGWCGKAFDRKVMAAGCHPDLSPDGFTRSSEVWGVSGMQNPSARPPEICWFAKNAARPAPLCLMQNNVVPGNVRRNLSGCFQNL